MRDWRAFKNAIEWIRLHPDRGELGIVEITFREFSKSLFEAW